MENSLRIAEQDYISRWTHNAKQHFEDGDYEWICDLIKKISRENQPHRIFEIGCGAGYSTLTFLLNNFEVVSIDVNQEAVNRTKNLIEIMHQEFKVVDVEKCLIYKADLINEFCKIENYVKSEKEKPIDIIVLCNPGGQLTEEISEQEYRYLKWGGFDDSEIKTNLQQKRIGLLQKWAFIYAACRLAIVTNIPLLIIERGTKTEVKEILELIERDTGLRKIRQATKSIENPPQNGIMLDNIGEDIFWGVALYYP